MSYKISVIVPVYKVENYIARCAASLLGQTLDEIEFVFVDDFTPDTSMEIIKDTLKKYPDRQNTIRYVRQPVNRGLAAARNAGLAIAAGKYVFHCDSDDWVEPDMLECMYRCAELNKADVVYADWYLSFKKNERLMHETVYIEPNDCLKAILRGKMKYNVWNKLVKRTLYTDNNILFPDGINMGEDMTIIKLFCHARKVVHINEAFYHYVQINTNAYTKTKSEAYLQQIHNNATNVINYIENMFGNTLNTDLQCFKLSVKLPLLVTGRKENYETWLAWFPEANCYISQHNSARIRLVQYAALNRQFWLLRLHYYGVMKLMYGIIYR